MLSCPKKKALMGGVFAKKKSDVKKSRIKVKMTREIKKADDDAPTDTVELEDQDGDVVFYLPAGILVPFPDTIATLQTVPLSLCWGLCAQPVSPASFAVLVADASGQA